MAGRRQQGEGSVYHRKARNQWVAVADLGWREGRRDRREFTGPTPEKALERRAKFLDARRDGFTLPKGRAPYVDEWVRHWLHNVARPRVDPNTWYRSYRQKCEDYIIPFFAKIRLAELSEEDIEAWHQYMLARASRRGGTLSPGTVVTAHRILSAALNVAVARRKLPHNPCAFVPPPKAAQPAPEPPSADEVRLILDACRGRCDGARWVLAICTGLRQGEALGLRWRDVTLTGPHPCVRVRQSMARVDRESVAKEPKSPSSRRVVPLIPRAVEALRAHREAQPVTDLSGLVFTDAAGRPLLPRADWEGWADLLGELGLPHYRVHDARHEFATLLLEGGADPRLVQDLMGHSTMALLKLYQHVRPAMHERAVEILSGILGS